MDHRPSYFKDIIGQKNVIATLKIAIESAKRRNDALGHILISSSPGFGKTTICRAAANELGVELKTIVGSNIRSFKDILPVIMNMNRKEILFIDEIHRVNKKIAESFYTILEDSRVDFIPGKDQDEIISIDLPKFTIIGATTELGSLDAPFVDRFRLKLTLEDYSNTDIELVIKKNISKIRIILEDSAISALAKASRTTPRIAISLLNWVRDYAVVHNLHLVNKGNVITALKMSGIDEEGFTSDDFKYLNLLKKHGVPLGISTISSTLNIKRQTIENVIEPFLLKKQLIIKTPKGRILC